MDPDDEFRDFGAVCRLFPLPGLVLFPHAVLPLHIFEPRYRQMTEHALAGDRLVTIVQARPLAGPFDLAPPIEEVGCLGKILIHERLPDGRFNFLLLGCRRVRLIRELDEPGTLYRQAEAELLEDIPPEEPSAPRAAEVIERFRTMAGALGGIDPDLAALLASDLPLGHLTDIVAHALALPPEVKQALLADRRVDRRADGLISIMQALATADLGPGSARRPFPPPFSNN